MRILVTGQTGTSKAEFAQKISQAYLAKRGISPHHPAASTEISWYEIEDPKWLQLSFRTFITDYDQQKLRGLWTQALERIYEDIEANSSPHVFLMMHATYFRDGHFFSPACWDDLLRFRPDLIITLIDDVYDIWQRIEDRQELETHFSLQEILNWRSSEILYSQALANELKINNRKFGFAPPQGFEYLFGTPIPFFVMSVKHTPEMFARLMFSGPSPQPVYASFPITRTRQSLTRIEDINKFRRSLRECSAAVVDPLTIDELRLAPRIFDEKINKMVRNALWYKLADLGEFQEYQKKRWAIDSPSVPPPQYTKSPFAGLSDQQIDDIVDAIGAQIMDRDYRLVGQCAKTIAFRPFYPKDHLDSIFGSPTPEPTGGVATEIRYAISRNQDVWVFHPRCDYQIEQEDKFFVDSAIWNRVRRFPSATKFDSLDAADFSGMDELLTALARATTRS